MDVVISEELGIFDLSKKYDRCRSMWPDKTHAGLSKKLRNFVTNPQITYFTVSVTQGRLVSHWKNNIIRPVFKAGTI